MVNDGEENVEYIMIQIIILFYNLNIEVLNILHVLWVSLDVNYIVHPFKLFSVNNYETLRKVNILNSLTIFSGLCIRYYWVAL